MKTSTSESVFKAPLGQVVLSGGIYFELLKR